MTVLAPVVDAYPADWPVIAAAVKAAAGWRCERCGHPDDPASCRSRGIRRGLLPCDDRCRHDAGDGKQRVLTVHHLDGVKANCARWNLAALCQVCHLVIQGRVDLRQAFLFPELHSEWFRPHLEGAMAAGVVA